MCIVRHSTIRFYFFHSHITLLSYKLNNKIVKIFITARIDITLNLTENGL